jgi:hypothetical protein
MFILRVFEFYIFASFEISKFQTLDNHEYQFLKFKKFRNVTDFKKKQKFKFLINTTFKSLLVSKYLIFGIKKDDSKNFVIISLDSSQF